MEDSAYPLVLKTMTYIQPASFNASLALNDQNQQFHPQERGASKYSNFILFDEERLK